MKEILSNYTKVLTEDGSTTLYSKVYSEACHSTSGAINETLLHYIDGCKVKDKSKLKEITIFETGFGVGIGFDQTLKTISDNFFTYISTEIDDELIEYVINNNDIFLNIIKYHEPFTYYELKNKKFRLIILQGNARDTLLNLSKIGNFSFDCIYQDAFSPKKNAILWTKQWFELLAKHSSTDCIMSTYSSSSSIRKSMIAAGWKLYEGEVFGTKRSSTRARLTGYTDINILKRLERSGAIMITDENYQDYTLDKK